MKAKNTTHDLLGKLPGADKVYLEQMMYATYCSALRDDKTITESERAKKLKIYNLEVRKALGSSPSTTKSNKQNRTTSSKAEPKAIDENILIKHAYLLPSPGFFGFSKENKSSFYETAFLEFDLTNISSSPLLITSMSVEISKNDKIFFADIVSGGAKIFHPEKNKNKPILIQPGKEETIKYFQAIRLPGLAELLNTDNFKKENYFDIDGHKIATRFSLVDEFKTALKHQYGSNVEFVVRFFANNDKLICKHKFLLTDGTDMFSNDGKIQYDAFWGEAIYYLNKLK